VIRYLKEIVYSIDPVTSSDITKTNQELCSSLNFIGEQLHNLNENVECLTAQLERIADKYCDSSE
jgi:hypothetical protein